MAATKKDDTLSGVVEASNDGDFVLSLSQPYVALVEIQGVSDMLFHRWSVEGVAAKAVAAKGSTGKKTDDIESYLWRCPDGTVGLPGEYLRQSIIGAAKFKQDPRSPRKSAMDLFKAGVVSLTDVATLGIKEPDYLDARRVTVQRAGITRVRPAVLAGWKASFELTVLTPEYINPTLLLEVLGAAGRLVGVADFRPTFGRFQVTSWSLMA